MFRYNRIISVFILAVVIPTATVFAELPDPEMAVVKGRTACLIPNMEKQLSSKTPTVPASALALATNTVLDTTFTPEAMAEQSQSTAQVVKAHYQTQYRTVTVDGLEIFYREAGPANAPTILLLHGFPTSSHMFRNLIPALSDRFHLVAPDYPGFGNSAMPSVDEFDYTFDRLADVMERFIEKLGLMRYSLYVMDYGAPVGFRLAVRHPERVASLIVQNGNAYVEGLREFWNPIRKYWKHRTPENAQALAGFIAPDGVKWQYTHGVRNEAAISPDNWNVDLRHLTGEGNPEIQLALFYDYQNNVPHYPAWQSYFRKYQPPTLIVWGKNDYIFPAEGAHPYKRDLKNLEFHLLDTGHFALEEDGELIAKLIGRFLSVQVASKR
jgi:pimeloyl-ACP methyl ester carboxylesterase